MRRFLGVLGFSVLLIFASQQSSLAQTDSTPPLGVYLKADQVESKVGDFRLEDLPKKAKRCTHEKDPMTGEVAKWEGYSLSALMDNAMEKLTMEQRANVDLIILVGKDGSQAVIPRALAEKYRLVLATRRNGKQITENRGPIYSIMPWDSQEKIRAESLPLSRYFIPGVTKIELAYARAFYKPFFLNKRTDPRAVRGERLFVQTCMACHDDGKRDPKEALKLVAANDHKGVVGFPSIDSTQTSALKSYFRLFQAQFSPDAGKQIH